MTDPIVVVDVSDVREGKLAELQAAMKELAEFVETNESRPSLYGMYLDEAGTRMTVVQVHPDSESAEFHMSVAASVFSQFRDLLTMRTMDVYGTPSPALLDKLCEKVRLLGEGVSLRVDRLHAGFARLDS